MMEFAIYFTHDSRGRFSPVYYYVRLIVSYAKADVVPTPSLTRWIRFGSQFASRRLADSPSWEAVKIKREISGLSCAIALVKRSVTSYAVSLAAIAVVFDKAAVQGSRGAGVLSIEELYIQWFTSGHWSHVNSS
jgi:hypothetical protein